VVATGGETYSFTLHTGQQLPEGVGSGGGGESGVPATGSNQILGIVVSIALFSAALASLKTSKINDIFERKMLRDFE
jgi:hypothetical protein